MTAEPAGHVSWAPDPIKQRMAAYTVEDVLLLPEDAPRVELRDGYDLGENGYELVADSAGELVLTAPFPIRLPIADITP